MSMFSGKQGKGAARNYREIKREEAVARNVAYQATMKYHLVDTEIVTDDPSTVSLLKKIFEGEK